MPYLHIVAMTGAEDHSYSQRHCILEGKLGGQRIVEDTVCSTWLKKLKDAEILKRRITYQADWPTQLLGPLAETSLSIYLPIYVW